MKSNFIQCRSGNGVGMPLIASKWKQDEPVSFIYAPAGVHTITAGIGRNDCVTITVENDEQTAKDLQASFDRLTASSEQEPYGDEDHESKKATLRFPAGVTKFTWGEIKGKQGVVVCGTPTGYGADAVNRKEYRSWSPEFGTDAAFTKAICLKCNAKVRECECETCHIGFPDGVKGSANNPARINSVNFVVGALTNKPAFQAMPPVKAKMVSDPNDPDRGDEFGTHDYHHHKMKADHHKAMHEHHMAIAHQHYAMHRHHMSFCNEEHMAPIHSDGNANAMAEYPHPGRDMTPHTHTASSKLNIIDALIQGTKQGNVIGGYLITASDGSGKFPTTIGGRPDHGLMSTAWGDLSKWDGPDKEQALELLRALFASEKLDLPRTKEQEIFASLMSGRTGTPAART